MCVRGDHRKARVGSWKIRGLVLALSLMGASRAVALEGVLGGWPNVNNKLEYVPRLNPAPLLPPASLSDPGLSQAWHLELIGAYSAWNVSKGDPASALAVVDTGINYNHPELTARFLRNPDETPDNGCDDDGNGLVDDVIGWDWIRRGGLPWDGTGQASAWAALAVATLGNGVGSAGVCPACSLIAERVFADSGQGSTSEFMKAIEDAAARGAKVVLTGIATPVRDYFLRHVFERAAQLDLVIVLGAGNHGANLDVAPLFPQSFGFPNTLVVAAASRSGQPTTSTSYGHKAVHLAAPGENLLTGLGGTHNRWSGTGAAAALVAGAAALVRSVAPNLPAEEVVKILTQTARPVPDWSGKTQSGGMLRVDYAVECARHLVCSGVMEP